MGVQFDPIQQPIQQQQLLPQPAVQPPSFPGAPNPNPQQTIIQQQQPQPLGPQGGTGLRPPQPQASLQPGVTETPAQAPVAQAFVAPGTAPTTPATPEEMEDVIAYARSKGYNLPFPDSEAAMEALLTAYQQQQQLGPYAQIGQQVAPFYDKFQAFLASQQQQTPAGAQQPAPKLWDAPEFDPQWETLVARDSHGNIIPAPGAPPDIAMKYQRYVAWAQDRARQMVRDPIATLGPIIEDIAEKKAKALYEQNISQLRTQNVWERFANENSQWMVARDQQGQPMIDRLTGQPMLTLEGQQFDRYLQQANQYGVKDPQSQINYARDMLFAWKMQQTPPAAPAAPAANVPPIMQQVMAARGNGNGNGQTVASDPRFEFLRQAAMHGSQHGATTAPQAGQQNPYVDSRSNLLQQLGAMYPNDAAFRQAVAATF